jgi:two-component system, OmpR family, sensor histidine kinase KdpD
MIPVDDDRSGRRDPEALLREIESAERSGRRGQLKIFLGYGGSPDASVRLFDEGRRRRERGEDVVIAATRPNPAPEVAPLIRELETVPAGNFDAGAPLNVEAVLARRPGVCLVDGLACDNPARPGRSTRHVDVEAVLAAGVSVMTSIDLAEIAEQQGFVRHLTGDSPPQAVPQEFISRADELVVVDVPSSHRQFRGGAASALRQRALLLTAEVVDRQLEEYLVRHGVGTTWGTQERILVCMTPRANAAAMLAAARRNVDQFHGELFAVYVAQPHLTEEDRMANERNATLARAQGARLDVLEGRDPVATILDYARRRHITQLFVGHSLPRTWRERLRRTPLNRLIRDADGMDVRVFPQ